ncbi:MAG: exosortase E/protease, VPEID-CTERM system [Terracidiphilus sp.]
MTVDCLLVSAIPHSLALLGPLAPCGIVSYAVFVGLGYSQLKARQEDLPFSPLLFAAHLLCIVAVCLGNFAALQGAGPQLDSTGMQLTARAILVLGIALLALACIPMQSWIAALGSTSPLWLFALLAGIAAWFLRFPFQSLWNASSNGLGRFLQAITFRSVGAVLQTFMPGALVDPVRFKVGTPRFAVIVAKECSGIEGLGLVLVFTIVWLAYFRKESRFPQALLLIPCALVSVWMLNIVRICSLILIGNAGARDVAMLGFHSQAGWIAFTTVAFAFSMATRKLSWVRRRSSVATTTNGSLALAGAGESGAVPVLEQSPVVDQSWESPAVRAYLMPFLAIVAASFVSKAASGRFEWLYPLRFVSAAAAIWFFRAELRKLNWRFGWIAPLTGAAISLLWIAPAWWIGDSSPTPLGASLAALSTPGRVVWIALRVAAAAITVPIAEELAFRGLLARRLIDREFERVPFSTLTPASIGVSSLAFALLHGQHWIAGFVAGLVFSLVLKWRGRMGDAVIAHATSNVILAAWVLSRGDFALW